MLDSLKHLARHCSRTVHWEKGAKHPVCVREPLKVKHLESHLANARGVGLAPIAPGESTTRVAVLDLDDHSGRLGWNKLAARAFEIVEHLRAHNARPHVLRSSGGKGIHIYLLWEEPQDAYSVRQWLSNRLAHCGITGGTAGLDKNQVEVFPKQDSVPADGVGSMFVLPFYKESVPIDATTKQMRLIDPERAESPKWWKYSPAVPVLEKPAPVEHAPIEDVELQKLAEALDAIPNEDEGLSYDEWRNIIFAIHAATGGSNEGLALAEKFSQRSAKCDLGFLRERVWPYCRERAGGITARTIFAAAREHGYDDTADYFEALDGDAGEGNSGSMAQGMVAGVQGKSDGGPGGAGVASEVRDDSGEVPIPTAQRPADSAEDKPARFKVVGATDLANRPPPKWHIKNVLPAADLAVLYGESTAGKSFIAFDMAAAIARGTDWRGHSVDQGTVIYVVAEGAGGFGVRAVAYHRQHGIEEPYPLGIIANAPNFLWVDDVREVIQAIHEFTGRKRVSLVVVDTLAQVTPGGNENSGEDMGKVLGHCRAINQTLKATVMLVHHSGKDLSRGARGWSGLKAAADAEFEVSRDGDLRILRISKLKDGQDGALKPFKLMPVPVGVDDEGDIVESCIVEHLPDIDVADRVVKLKGEWPIAIYKAARDLQPMDGSGVPLSDVIEAAIAQRGLTADAKLRGNVRRAVPPLEERGLLTVDEKGLCRLGNSSLDAEYTHEEVSMSQESQGVSSQVENGCEELY